MDFYAQTENRVWVRASFDRERGEIRLSHKLRADTYVSSGGVLMTDYYDAGGNQVAETSDGWSKGASLSVDDDPYMSVDIKVKPDLIRSLCVWLSTLFALGFGESEQDLIDRLKSPESHDWLPDLVECDVVKSLEHPLQSIATLWVEMPQCHALVEIDNDIHEFPIPSPKWLWILTHLTPIMQNVWKKAGR